MDGQIVGSADPALSRIHRVRLRLPQGRLVACNKVSSVSRCQSGPRSPGCHASHFYTFPPGAPQKFAWFSTGAVVGDERGRRGVGVSWLRNRSVDEERGCAARLKGSTRVEFQACSRYLPGISSRYISARPPSVSLFSSLPPLIPPASHPVRLSPERYFICKELVCRLPLLLILCAQEFLLGSAEISYCSRRNRGRQRG